LITVYSRSGAYCGLLCTHITRALTQIAQKCFLRFEAFVSSENKEKANSISINIYGLLEDSETIGDLLSDNEVFLQRPSKYDDSYEYRNPQYFTIPETERMGIETDTDLSHDSAAVLRHRWTNDVQDMLETLLPSTTSQTWPQECVVSNRIKTPMLEHQQQALCFMREREEVHCHINSNYHRQNCLGGILADQMGLGKSLTALALVAGSIPEEDIRDGLYDTRQTLIVVPASTMSTWLEQIQVHIVPDCLRTLVYHGSRRKSAFAEMKSPHVVLTTYTTLVSDWQSKNSPLYEKEWFRVIIDEVHFIKDRTTKRFQAVCSLKGERRWCLTGTPIQNCIDDLGALLIFIRSAPFDNHREFQTQVITPLKNGDSHGLLTLRSALRAVMLRRTKQVLHLPPREDLELELALSQNERELYEIARDETEFIIEGCLESSDFSKGLSIIQSILRQRQICNHGVDLLPQGVRSRLLRRHRVKTWSKESPPEEGYPTFCEACNLEMAQDECEVPFEFCLHLVCSKCLQGQSAENDVGNLCPICNEMESRPTKEESSFRAWANELDYSGPSAKVRALLENIQQLNKEDNTAKR
jgi:SWI/SNF-related matrix-associated actin-dependent regulator of chromatin subfamily A3